MNVIEKIILYTLAVGAIGLGAYALISSGSALADAKRDLNTATAQVQQVVVGLQRVEDDVSAIGKDVGTVRDGVASLRGTTQQLGASLQGLNDAYSRLGSNVTIVDEDLAELGRLINAAPKGP